MLVGWNDTRSALPAGLVAHELFAASARRFPEAVAVACGGRRLLYRELDERSERLARRLAALGVGAEVLVGLCLERTPDLVVAMLAVLKAGGAYVPLDPSHPRERLSWILEASGAAVLLADRASLPALPASRARVIDPSAEPGPEETGEEGAPGLPRRRASPGNLAYVIFTSGSTGQPKGVEVSHRGVVNYLASMARRPGLNHHDAVLALTTLSFDIAVTELLLPLAVGARIELVDHETAADGGRLAAVLEAAGVTVMQATPATWTLLLESGWPGRAGLKALAGGEALPATLAERLLPRTGELWNVYGPTETTVWSTLQRLVPDGGRISIGRPLANTTIYLEAPAGGPVPAGVAGELCIGGEGLARGYLGRPDLTAERFVPDGLSGNAGERLYRTGDLARWRPDGAVEYLGRLDQQIKIRGFRIELGEIEAALAGHPAVLAAAVAAVESEAGRRLVAYVVPAGEAALDPAGLERHLRGRLPEYMVPALWMEMPALPLTGSGKLDRRALPVPEAKAGQGGVPGTPAEMGLARVWGEVLGLAEVGLDDRFFALGGDSIQVLQAVRLAAREGWRLTPRQFFQHPSLAELARVASPVEEGQASEGGGRTEELDRSLRARPELVDLYALSPAQEGILFHTLESGDPGLYGQQVAWTVRSPFDEDAFVAAWRLLVARHPALRTSFLWGETEAPLQGVHREVELPVERLDWRGEPAAGRAGRLAAYLAADRHRGFDPARPPLLRLAVIRLEEDVRRVVATLHHLVLDGWSLGLALGEVAALQAALQRGEEARLAPPRPFRDFIAWLASRDAGEAEAFWRRELDGFTEPTPVGEAGRGAPPLWSRRTLRVPAAAWEERVAAARRQGITAGTLLQGAWALLLHRYGGGDDVVFGAVSSGRPATLAGAEAMLGVLVATLPVRARVRSALPAAPWLRELQAGQAAARQHEHTPLARIQEWSEMAAGRPLFDSLLVVENYPLAGALRAAGVAPGDVEAEERNHYPVTLSAVPLGGLELQLHGDGGRFDAGAAGRLLGHLDRLLAGLAASPDAPLGDLPLLTAAEHRQVTGTWSRGEAVAGPGHRLHDLFAAQARRTPEAVALAAAGEELTYRELAALALALARRLAAAGARPEARVGIFLERSVAQLVALLAVLESGAAYVPLEPSHPAERIGAIVEDAGLALVVTREGLAAALAATGYAGRQVWAEVDREGEAPVAASDPAGRGLAYVLYTSGSTGRPKGVMVAHRSICNRVLWVRGAFAFDAGERLLYKTPFSFDASIWEIFAPWTAGGRVVLARPDGHQDAAYLAAAVREHEITTLQLVPSMLQLLLEEPGLAACVSLRRLFCGGEALNLAMVERLLALLPGVEMHNLYGPTEASIDVSHWPCRSAAPQGAAIAPIGRPLPGIRLFLLDGEMRPVPPGVPGQLHAGGIGLARGYRGRPDLTAEKFLPDPLGGEPGERLYATGDLGRWLPGGDLEFLGRLDHQVKVRGWRIELGEVESALLRHPAVREAVAVVRAGPGGLAGGSLAGYLVAKSGIEIDREELRRFLAARLPAVMVPSDLVVLASLPTLPSGKLDRGALPAPESLRAPAGGRDGCSLTPTEELLAGIWCAVLGLPSVSPDESFFAAGGHSLLALRVVSRVRETLGVELALRDLFDAPSLAALAVRIQELRRTAPSRVAPLVRREPGDAPPPLSFAQQRLWFLHELDPRSASYNLPAVLRIRGPLDAGALGRALDGIVRRHEVLRTAFLPVAGQPAQVVRPFAPLPLPMIDLSALSGGAREGAARALVRDEVRRPFDLAAGETLRATLLRLGEGEHRLALTLHHIVSDAWSADILLREAGVLYDAFAAGRPSPRLPALPVQYADFALWQREWLQGEALAAEIAFWRQQLAGASPVLDLPSDRPRPAELSDVGDHRSLALPARLTPALAGLARSAGATLFMTLLAAFEALLARLSGQRDLTVGTPVAGRTRLETEELIGFFVNTLVLRADLSGRPTGRELLARVREVTLAAHDHQDLPFEKLVEELRPERSLGHTPFFQVAFVLQNASRRFVDAARLAGCELAILPTETGTAKFDLMLRLEESTAGWGADLEFRRDLFDAVTAERILGHFGLLLEGLAAAPGRVAEDLPLLGAAERHQALVEWNVVARPARPLVALHRLFEAQAAARPAAVALVCGEERVTYGELDVRANRLARHLRALGVGAESLVALCLERSVDQVVAVLAVLKSGGPYLPLEPGYPAERLAFTLADSAARWLVTTATIAAVLPAGGAQRVLLDGDAAAIAARSGEDLAGEADVASLAYVIYTSGSTGRAKGVLVPHFQVARLLAATEADFAFGPADVWTLFHSYAFDFSVWEIWGALAYGGRLVIVPSLVSRSPEDFRELLRREGVTVLNQTPSAFRQLAALEREAPETLADLRFVLFGGEALDPSWLAPWAHRYGVDRPRLVNLYGITETTVHVTVRPLAAADIARAGTSPVGRPIGDLEVHLLDPRMEPVPLGVSGEIYVGGAGVARGYLGRAELTAERFVPHPFAGEAGARLYRSGDLARRQRDGGLEILGRSDHQVKIRGFRVELGEIEAALSAHPQVREAVVLLREQGGEKRLVAYAVLGEGGDVPDRDFREFLARRLPEPMLPAAFVRLASLPLTGNGKLDRGALAALAVERSGEGAESLAPRTAVEQVVAGVFGELLGVDGVGLRDDFFLLGGHSLLATQVVARLQQVFRVKVALRDFFGASTVESVAALLVASEPVPHRLERIAKLLQSIEAMPADELRAAARESRIGRIGS